MERMRVRTRGGEAVSISDSVPAVSLDQSESNKIPVQLRKLFIFLVTANLIGHLSMGRLAHAALLVDYRLDRGVVNPRLDLHLRPHGIRFALVGNRRLNWHQEDLWAHFVGDLRSRYIDDPCQTMTHGALQKCNHAAAVKGQCSCSL